MSETENTKKVQDIYAAFGRGDIAAILNSLADEIEWHHPGPPDVLPWAKSRHSRAEVEQFFKVLGETHEFEAFEPREYVAQGDTVVVLGWSRARAKSTGRIYEEHWAMVWTFRNGKVVGYRAYDDTAAMVAAFKKG
jgi:uncharacterized protein